MIQHGTYSGEPPRFHYGLDGRRRPAGETADEDLYWTFWKPDKIPWTSQQRLIHALRNDRHFREEVLDALGFAYEVRR